MLTQPRCNPGILRLRKMLIVAKAMSSITRPPTSTCPLLTLVNRGSWRCRISNNAIVIRLNRLLPKASPKARLGAPTKATALIPVNSSGKEVAVAMSNRPIHTPPSPVLSAIISPYLDSLVPANKTTSRQTINFAQIKSTSLL